MKPLTVSLLALTEQPYDNYNTILPQIKEKLRASDIVGEQRVQTFERTLSEELPLTTGRRAFQTAICSAMGETEGFTREFHPIDRNPRKQKAEKTPKK